MQCWSPQTFTDSMEKFADFACTNVMIQLLSGVDNTTFSYGLFKPFQSGTNKEHPLEMQDIIGEDMSMRNISLHPQQGRIYGYILSQLVIACLLYSVKYSIGVYGHTLSHRLAIHKHKMLDDLLIQRKLAISYLIVQICTSLTWLVVASACYVHCIYDDAYPYRTASSYHSSGLVLCSFSIQQLGNIYEHNVPCAYSLTFQHTHGHLHSMMVISNVILGYTLLFLALYSIFYTFIIVSIFHQAHLLSILQKVDNRKEKIESSSFYISDLNMVMMYSNDCITFIIDNQE